MFAHRSRARERTSTQLAGRRGRRPFSIGRRGFTLIEVLVVVAILALLISILLPSLHSARAQARGAVCLSNLKQVGTGLAMYVLQSRDVYPMHSSLASQTTALGRPRTRWPDYLHRHMRSEEVYECPSMTATQREDFAKQWAHNPTKHFGGYGYNFQYLGNSRHWEDVSQLGAGVPREWNRPFFARQAEIRHPATTVAIGDTAGSKNGNPDHRPGEGGAAVYAIDPPLGSLALGSKGSRKNRSSLDASNFYYEGGSSLDDEELYRSPPDRRHNQRANIVFADGHAERMDVDVLDGRVEGEAPNNRFYNGLNDPARR